MAIKVHFVTGENSLTDVVGLRAAGVHYALFSSYKFIANKPSSSGTFRVNDLRVKKGGFKHIIVDSGVFTLMYGARKGIDATPELMREWMHRLVRFIVDNDIDGDVVEVDCQKICSPEVAWELRREMRELLPAKNGIINVYHTEDGEDGFRRIVEFSDYIAIGCPELRVVYPDSYEQKICDLARLAKALKPDIRIHLLGCTENELLKKNAFCTTCDSTSWKQGLLFGNFRTETGKHHISQIRPKVLSDARRVVSDVECATFGTSGRTDKRTTYIAHTYICAKLNKQKYTQLVGSQE